MLFLLLSTLLSPWVIRKSMCVCQIILVSVFFACSFPLSILLVVIVTVTSVLLIFQGLTRIFFKLSLVTVLCNASLSNSLTVIAFLNLFVPAVPLSCAVSWQTPQSRLEVLSFHLRPSISFFLTRLPDFNLSFPNLWVIFWPCLPVALKWYFYSTFRPS